MGEGGMWGRKSDNYLDDVLVNCGRSGEREGNAHRDESARYVEEAENHSGNLHIFFKKKSRKTRKSIRKPARHTYRDRVSE